MHVSLLGGGEHSSEGINDCHLCNAKLVNELSVLVSDSVKCKQTKVNTYVLDFRANVGLPNG